MVCIVNPNYSLPITFDHGKVAKGALEIHFESIYGATSSDSVNLCSLFEFCRLAKQHCLTIQMLFKFSSFHVRFEKHCNNVFYYYYFSICRKQEICPQKGLWILMHKPKKSNVNFLSPKV